MAVNNSTNNSTSELTIGGTTTVNKILDEDTLSSDDPQALATQQSIKAYVDATSGGVPGGADTQVQYNNAGTFAGNANFTFTQGTGAVTINGSLDTDNLKFDGNVISSTDANGDVNINPNGSGKFVVQGTTGVDAIINDNTMATATATSLATSLSIKNYVLSLPGNLPGGADTQVQFNDGGSFGGDANMTFTKGTGAFAVTGSVAADNLKLDGNILSSTDTNGDVNINPDGSGKVVIQGTTGVDGVIDDDTMATASATKLATSESIKAYVDAQSGGGGGGSYTFLSTQTVSAVATVEFTDLDDTYDQYVFYLSNVVPVSNGVNIRMRTSSDNGVSYDSGASDYGSLTNGFTYQGANAGAPAAGGVSYINLNNNAAGTGLTNTASMPMNAEVIMQNHANASSNTGFLTRSNYAVSSSNGTMYYGGGVRHQAGIVNAVQFLVSTGNFSAATISVYGIKNAASASSTNLTDWVQYTPTFQGFGTPSEVEIYSRRVGDTLEVRGTFRAGTVTATEAQITLGYNGTNSNITSSSSIIGNLQIAGDSGNETNAASTFNTTIQSNVGYLTFGSESQASGLFTLVNGSQIVSSNGLVTFTAQIPVDSFPSVTPTGLIGTDWVAYTPTFQGFGTPANIEFWSRRVGDSLEVRGRFDAGTTTAAEAQITLGYNGTDSNVNTSATKITSLAYLGSAIQDTNPSYPLNVMADANVGYMNFSFSGGGTGGPFSKLLGNNFVTGDTIAVQGVFPIDTWPA